MCIWQCSCLRRKLTLNEVLNLAPREKSYKCSDGEGLYIEVTLKGGKYWRQKYRYAGKKKRLAHGVFPSASLKEARQKKYEARAVLAQGRDPAAVNRKVRSHVVVGGGIYCNQELTCFWHGLLLLAKTSSFILPMVSALHWYVLLGFCFLEWVSRLFPSGPLQHRNLL